MDALAREFHETHDLKIKEELTAWPPSWSSSISRGCSWRGKGLDFGLDLLYLSSDCATILQIDDRPSLSSSLPGVNRIGAECQDTLSLRDYLVPFTVTLEGDFEIGSGAREDGQGVINMLIFYCNHCNEMLTGGDY